ncbi:MAG: tail fiber domain-containing protein [Candidatus Omnitrophica bacterium]|nr:tail fiber domain-containing protein [Candidatus Omnitrophota bacterium]
MKKRSRLFISLGLGLFLGGAALAETVEMVTYYPAAAPLTEVDRLHANRASIGTPYNPTFVPDDDLPDGTIIISGNVGIGTATPTANIGLGGDAARTIQMERHPTANTAGNALLLLAGGASIGATNRNGGSLFLSSGIATGNGSSTIEFLTATAGGAGTANRIPNTKMVILGSGNVGIGTVNPTANLGFNGDAAQTIRMERHTGNNQDGNNLLLQAGGSSVGNNNRTGGSLILASGISTGNQGSSIFFQTAAPGSSGSADRIPSTKMTILGNGNVGIGITNPGHLLEVNHTGANPYALRVFSANTDAMYVEGELIGARLNGSTAVNSYGSLSTGGLVGVYGQATRNTSYGGYFLGNTIGAVGIGQTSSSYGVYGVAPRWGTVGLATESNGVGVYGYADVANGSGLYSFGRSIGASVESSANDGLGLTAVANGNNSIGVRGSGRGFDFYAAGPGTNYGAPSSIRWKRNVRPIENALSKVKRIRGVSFDWTPEFGGVHDIGVVGEEVGEVFPEIVRYEPNGVDAQGIDYGKLTPALVEAIKELSAKVEILEAELAALKRKQANR